MDTTDSQITFNKDGVCDHCISFDQSIKPNWPSGEDAKIKLESLVDEIKKDGEGNDFDCIIGMSGGIDSSYLTYKAKELGLKPLVFHVDAGWNSQVAVNNIEKLIDNLNLDLHTEVINWREMRDLQLAYFKSGLPNIDTPQDHAFFATMYKFAQKYNVKNILTGANLSTECIRNPLEWMYYQSDSVQLKDIHNKFGEEKLKSFPITSILNHKIFLPYFRGIRVRKPLDLMDYDKKEAMNLLKEKFGWIPYPQKHFESRFTRFYEGYWLLRRFGYDTRKVQFSSLILTNQMTRKEALKELESPPLKENEIKLEFDFVCNKLEISRDELKTYFNLPKRKNNEFKSQSWIYSLGAFLMKTMRLEIGGKR